RQGLRFAINLHAFLRFHGLVQPVAPTASRHFAAGELIDNHDLVLLNDILNVFFEEAVGAQQLRDVMDPLGLLVAMLLALRFFLVLFLLRQCWIEIDLGEFVDQIRKYKCIRIVWIKEIAALLRQISLVRFLIDREEEFFLESEQLLLAGVLIKRKFRFIHRAALVGIFHHTQELFIARLPKLHFEHKTTARLHVTLLEFLDRLTCHSVTEHILLTNQLLNKRFPSVVLMRRDRRR